MLLGGGESRSDVGQGRFAFGRVRLEPAVLAFQRGQMSLRLVEIGLRVGHQLLSVAGARGEGVVLE